MVPNRRFVSWTLAVASALAFVVGASAQQLARVVSQAVVTPDDPIFAPQDPQPPPQQQQQQEPEQRRPWRWPRQSAGRAASVQPGHHQRRQDR